MSWGYQLETFPLQEYLGCSMETVGTGQVRAVIEVGPSALNPNGVVHGAVFFALADTAMEAATTSVIDDDMASASIVVTCVSVLLRRAPSPQPQWC
ncbi:MAG: PaaI family thioesterase [Actinomycetota bacterium]